MRALLLPALLLAAACSAPAPGPEADETAIRAVVAAMLTGRYRLEGGAKPQDGINTRLFRKVNGKWVIALNHVSSKELTPPPAATRRGRHRRKVEDPGRATVSTRRG
jgi:hypothetical protein